MKQTIIICLASALCFPAQCIASWFGPDNFDECMVDKMRGQSNNAYSHIYKVCREKFPIKEPNNEKIPLTKDAVVFSWKYGEMIDGLYGKSKPYVAFTIEANRTGYNLSYVIAEFSQKNCESSVNEDYKYKFTFGLLIISSGIASTEYGKTL